MLLYRTCLTLQVYFRSASVHDVFLPNAVPLEVRCSPKPSLFFKNTAVDPFCWPKCGPKNGPRDHRRIRRQSTVNASSVFAAFQHGPFSPSLSRALTEGREWDEGQEEAGVRGRSDQGHKSDSARGRTVVRVNLTRRTRALCRAKIVHAAAPKNGPKVAQFLDQKWSQIWDQKWSQKWSHHYMLQ